MWPNVGHYTRKVIADTFYGNESSNKLDVFFSTKFPQKTVLTFRNRCHNICLVKVIAETVEPAVKSALDGYGLNGFKFEKVVLGQIPPRVTGIKVYDKNVGRNEIIMDLVRLTLKTCGTFKSVFKCKLKLFLKYSF